MNVFWQKIENNKWPIAAAILVVLATFAYLFYSANFTPAGRDSKRLKELKNLEAAIGQYLAGGNADLDGPDRGGTCVDEANPTIYVSIPSDPEFKLPELPAGWHWGQASKADLKKTNGLGWLPLDLRKYIKKLLFDPLNTADPADGKKNFFYVYACSAADKKFELATKLESKYYGPDHSGSGGKNDAAFTDGGKFAGLYETGSDPDLLPDDGIFCPAGMVWVGPNRLNAGFCIDAYEDSWSEGNKPVSAANKDPWSSLPGNIFPAFGQEDAAKFCQSAGKRLPLDYEWFLAAHGTPDEYLAAPAIGEEPCHQWNIHSDWPEGSRKPEEAAWQDTDYQWSDYNKGFIKTGTARRCRSAYGAFDMAGNLFEFTADTQAGKKYKDLELPSRAYVSEINEEGIPVRTAENPRAEFHGDYFWLDNEANHAFLRGGSWFDGEKAGVFSLNLILDPRTGDYNVGFRCAK